MVRSHIDNYLGTHRRHSGLSQAEVAWIVEAEFPDVISRIERGDRLPTLKVALRLEVLFGVPVGAIFAGTREHLARRVEHRVRVHYRRIKAQPAMTKGRRVPSREAKLAWHGARLSRRRAVRS